MWKLLGCFAGSIITAVAVGYIKKAFESSKDDSNKEKLNVEAEPKLV